MSELRDFSTSSGETTPLFTDPRDLTIERRMLVKGRQVESYGGNKPERRDFTSSHRLYGDDNSRPVAIEAERIGQEGLPEWQPHITEVIVETRLVSEWSEEEHFGPPPLVEAEETPYTQDLVVLKCRGRNHVTLWPLALTPFPKTCPCSVGTYVTGRNESRCGQELFTTPSILREVHQ